MHCAREGHLRVEMIVLEVDDGTGTVIHKCPTCGRTERQQHKAVLPDPKKNDVPPAKVIEEAPSRPAAPRGAETSHLPLSKRVVDFVVRLWNKRGEIKQWLESVLDNLDDDELMEPRREKRHKVRLDQANRVLITHGGPPVPFDEATVHVYRRRTAQPALSRSDADNWALMPYEVYARHGKVRVALAEFNRLGDAEKYADEIRDAIA